MRRVRISRETLSHVRQDSCPLPPEHGQQLRRPVVQDPVRRGFIVAGIRLPQQLLPDHLRLSDISAVRDQTREPPLRRVRDVGHGPPGYPAQRFFTFQRHQQQHHHVPQLHPKHSQLAA